MTKINECQTKVVVNCLLYALMSTSSRIIIDNAINIEAILHAKSFTQGKGLHRA
jgi:hypothetical protein